MFISKLQIIFACAHVICIHVDAAAEGVAFEVIVEPQAPRSRPSSRKLTSTLPKAQLSLALSSSSPKASPGASPTILN